RVRLPRITSGCRFSVQVPSPSLREAKRRSNPAFLLKSRKLDCFASLAMTSRRHRPAMLTLYFAPGSSSMAVHIALHEIGAPFEARPMSFKNNDMRAAEFLKVNPAGKVPTLLIDGRGLTGV